MDTCACCGSPRGQVRLPINPTPKMWEKIDAGEIKVLRLCSTCFPLESDVAAHKAAEKIGRHG